jgi:type VI secretion system secreted protein Hcp
MGWISGRRAWRVAVVPVVVVALFVGYAAFGNHDAKPRSVHLTAQDLLLAATQARKGISLEYDGITGPPSTNHTNHAVLHSFSFSVKRPVAVTPGSPRETGAPSISEIRITKSSDKYSALLLRESLVGTGAKNAVIYFTNLTAAGVPFDYLEFDLENVLVSSFSMSSGGDVPTETLTLNFTKITMKAHFPGTTQQIVSFDLQTLRAA